MSELILLAKNPELSYCVCWFKELKNILSPYSLLKSLCENDCLEHVIVPSFDSPALCWASQVALVVKKLPANAGDTRDMGLIPGCGRSPGGGHGNPVQYSCLENHMERGAVQFTVLQKVRHGRSNLAEVT